MPILQNFSSFFLAVPNPPSAQQAVWRNGGLVPSKILFNFAAAVLARAVVETATAPSCLSVSGNFGRQRRSIVRLDKSLTQINLTNLKVVSNERNH